MVQYCVQARSMRGDKMQKEIRTICYDEELKVEAYHYQGIKQTFPNHFHEYYMIAYIQDGKHLLSVKDGEYIVQKGDIAILHPGENHTCAKVDNWALDYWGLNITREVMAELYRDITGKEGLPGFTQTVIHDEELNAYLRPLNRCIMEGSGEFEKEELLFFFVELLIQRYGQPFESRIRESGEEIERACAFMETHFAERISLDQLCRHSGMSKSTLLRNFTRVRGVTPYRYLEMVRINQAKKLLEQGMTPMETALEVGFSDQSHFTNYFNMFIGISPGVYRDIFLKHSKERQEKDSYGQ